MPNTFDDAIHDFRGADQGGKDLLDVPESSLVQQSFDNGWYVMYHDLANAPAGSFFLPGITGLSIDDFV